MPQCSSSSAATKNKVVSPVAWGAPLSGVQLDSNSIGIGNGKSKISSSTSSSNSISDSTSTSSSTSNSNNEGSYGALCRFVQRFCAFDGLRVEG